MGNEYTLDCATWDWDGGDLQGAHVMLANDGQKLVDGHMIDVLLCPGYEHCWSVRGFGVPAVSLVPYAPITAQEIGSVIISLAGILEELRG